MINSRDCTGCAQPTGFDFMKSFSIRKIVDKHLRYLIGGYLAQGVLVQDDLLVASASYAIKQFPFLLVNEWQQGVFERVDGVIGLSRDYISTNGSNSGSQFLDSLYTANQIDSKIFAIHFDAKEASSQLTLGGYNAKFVAPGTSLKFLKTPYSKKW